MIHLAAMSSLSVISPASRLIASLLIFSLLVCGVAIVSLSFSCAKKPAVIKGVVQDDKGEPLGGAAVYSIPQRYQALTDTLGQFRIESVEPGQYALLVKFGLDSAIINLGTIEPGETKDAAITVVITPPPAEPKPVDTIPPPPKEPPKPPPEPKFVDPLENDKNVLLLCDENHLAKYEVESSDGLSWELKKGMGKLDFEESKIFEGYFAGPRRKSSETAAARVIYDKKYWIYTHGPDNAPANGRTISIAIPVELPQESVIDSFVIYYGIPVGKDRPKGSLQLRAVGENEAGKVTILFDWEKVDHLSAGSFYKKITLMPLDFRRLTYLTLEIDSDGEVAGDDFLLRPLIYFE